MPAFSVRRLLWGSLVLCSTAAAQPPADKPEPRLWLKTPCVSVMTGFIYEPLKSYTIQQWIENLGSRFDADRWVRDFQEAGASHLVFYDKWIDGLVFHDTRTTGFKTRRDFVRELAAACQRAKLPLVLYFNAVSDGNPEFDQWALTDERGQPLVFSPNWPSRYQTLHSPFHDKVLGQVRELLSNYGPIQGLWHDIFHERPVPSNPWMIQGYQKMFGEPLSEASRARLDEFGDRTLAGYLEEIDAIRRQQGQAGCVFTANGSGANFLRSDKWTALVGARLQYLFMEGHSFAKNDRLARMAWVLPKPLDVNLLLSSTWFAPLDDTPPPEKYSLSAALAATAIAVCQGAGVCWALTPDHSGQFGEDLAQAKAVGAWFRRVKPYLENAQPYADVGLVLGTPAADGPGFGVELWKHAPAAKPPAEQVFTLGDSLLRAGLFSRVLYDWQGQGSWPDSLAANRAIVLPEQCLLDAKHAEQIRQYVAEGGVLITFAHASLLDGQARRGDDFALADVLGAHFLGEQAVPVSARGSTVKVDSQYSEEYGARNLIDGLPTAWASGRTPMPHWVEITLPEPVDVQAVEIVNREGPYRVADLDVEVPQANSWRVVQSVRDANTPTIAVRLKEAVRTDRLRVTIRRELYRGQDRQYADLEAIRVLDAQGTDWAGRQAQGVQLQGVAPDAKRCFPDGLKLPPYAVTLEPATAEVLARLDLPGGPPAVLRNRFGRGQAILVAVSDAVLADNRDFWTGLLQLAGLPPTLSVDPDDAGRFRFILTGSGQRHVLHVIDAQVRREGYTPRTVPLVLDAKRLGNPRRAQCVEEAAALELTSSQGQLRLSVTPNPVSTIVLEGP